MRHIQRLTISGIVLAALAAPSALQAQRGRGGSTGPMRSGGAGRMNVPPAHSPQTGYSLGGPGEPGAVHGANRASTPAGIAANPALSSRAQSMLPPGSSVVAAAEGFRNEADFLTALHASRSLNVPFDRVRQRMTGGDGMPLDKTLRELRPDLDKNAVKRAVKDAGRMAKQDLRESKRHDTGTSMHGESAAAAAIRMNPALEARVTPLLPSGVTLVQASAGFRNTGQFVAALHVSKNLEIPFSELRARMIAGGESLGEAIHAVRPAMGNAGIGAAVRAAGRSAENDAAAESSGAASSGTRGRVQ